MEHGSPPSADLVYQGICQLFHNTNPKEKEKANKWLEEFQKSIYSWTIADELLQQKRDLHSCYFAAQTMRNKIQTSFDELPESSHGSLRDSLITHIGQITAETDPIIMTQLCLAIADLALLMANWEAPISDLLDILSPHSSPQAVWPLLEILTRLPEEVESRCLRLGNNRREELYAQLKVAAPQVLDFLCMCVQRAGDIDVSSASNSKSHENVMKQRLLNSTIRCFNSWVVIDSIPVSQLTESVLAQRVFQLLSHADAPDKLHDTASDCLCAILSCIEKHGGGDPPSADIQQLQPQIINAVCSLENVYHMSVAQEDIDKAMNYCRIFTTLCDAFFYDFFKNDKEELHYSVKCLDMVLMCVGHFDYEVAEITFALWYRLSESLFQIQNQELTDHFKPYIERLLGALYRHAQMDSDSTGLIEEQDSFYDFRRKVSDLIKDVAFIVGSGACFRQMFMLLQTPNNSWEATESALFIMQNVAKCVVPTENEVIPKVVEAILNMPENTHIAVRYTSIMLLGELCEWIEEHPESLEAVLNFLLYSLQQTNGVASAAAVALTSISATCRHKMIMHMSGFVEIARRLDTFEISNELAIGFLKSMSLMLSRLPRAQLESTMREVISFQLQPLADLVDDAASTPATIRRDTRSDPAYWIDRACAIVRFTIPIFEDDLAANSAGSNNNNNNNNNNNMNNNNNSNNNNNNNNNNHNHNNNNGNYHPTLQILTEAWPLLSRVMDKYQSVMRVMERTCRLIRYALRMIRKQAAMMLDPLLKKMVGVYVTNHHSCFLYLGSVLVDELACMPDCVPQLLEMLQAFVEPTFNMLSVDGGLKNNPDTVDDFFRLCSRFVVCCPLPLLESALVPPVLRCALLSCTLDHREANKSVMQFFTNLLKWGRVPNERLLACKPLVVQIAILHGEDLAVNLIHSSIFCLHSYMLPDVGEVLYELKTVVQPDKMKNFLRVALDALPKKNSGGYVTATQKQLDDFITTTLSADCSKTVSQALKTFTRLYK